MIASLEFWEQKHRKYIMKDCVLEPNFLIHDLVDALPKGSRILDLGCGQGQDAVYLAAQGYQVTAADFSPFALSHFPDRAPELGVESLLLDLREIPYRFTNDSFDAVCAHLSLHYFPIALTKDIFAEIARIIRPEGWFFALFNSVRDPECGTGVEIEPQYWEISPGDRKRFFSVAEMPCLLGGSFTIDSVDYGTGTRKNVRDEFVRMVAKTV
jgi:SAM-dependent methyltransferase